MNVEKPKATDLPIFNWAIACMIGFIPLGAICSLVVSVLLGDRDTSWRHMVRLAFDVTPFFVVGIGLGIFITLAYLEGRGFFQRDQGQPPSNGSRIAGKME